MRLGWASFSGAVMLAVTAIGCDGSSATVASGASTSPPRTVKLRDPDISMEPTIKPGSVLTVHLGAYSHTGPALGDIVVFHPPRGADSDTPVCDAPRQGANPNGGLYAKACGVSTARASRARFVERVVGLPGDRITIVRGHVIRNGARERDRYIVGCGPEVSCDFPEPITIPRGEYFTLGDNRPYSDDGRFWGPVHRAWMIGKVVAHT